MALYQEAIQEWTQACQSRIAPGQALGDVALHLAQAVEATPLCLPLLKAHATFMGGRDVGEALLDIRRAEMASFTVLANHLIMCFGVPAAQARELSQALKTTLLGAAQSELQWQGATANLPADLQKCAALSGFRATFVLTAEMLLTGGQTSSGSRPNLVASGATVSP